MSKKKYVPPGGWVAAQQRLFEFLEEEKP